MLFFLHVKANNYPINVNKKRGKPSIVFASSVCSRFFIAMFCSRRGTHYFWRELLKGLTCDRKPSKTRPSWWFIFKNSWWHLTSVAKGPCAGSCFLLLAGQAQLSWCQQNILAKSPFTSQALLHKQFGWARAWHAWRWWCLCSPVSFPKKTDTKFDLETLERWRHEVLESKWPPFCIILSGTNPLLSSRSNSVSNHLQKRVRPMDGPDWPIM